MYHTIIQPVYGPEILILHFFLSDLHFYPKYTILIVFQDILEYNNTVTCCVSNSTSVRAISKQERVGARLILFLKIRYCFNETVLQATDEIQLNTILCGISICKVE